MDSFHYDQNGELFCEDLNVASIAAKVKTPFFLYSAHTFRDHFRKYQKAFESIQPLICFSMKTCNNIFLLQELIKEGSGIDTVSGGEIYFALKAGVAPEKIVYAGIGKTTEEIEYALDQNIGTFNIESEQEFENISRIAKEKGKKTKAALRVTPDVVDEKTHAKTKTGGRGSKFGVDIERAKQFFHTYGKDESVDLCGIHIHIGSPIFSSQPYVLAIHKIIDLVHYLEGQGFKISILDIGGGFAADYTSGKSPSHQSFAEAIVPLLKPFYDKGVQIVLEPGRSISGNAGILVTTVSYTKTGGDKQFAVVDTGMHHLIRPTLYEAQHYIWPIKVTDKNITNVREIVQEDDSLTRYDVVGPICESGDYLAKDRLLPELKRGDMLAIFTAGAYGIVMSSQYNAMPRPPEILVDGKEIFEIRERETYEDLLLKIKKKPISL